MMMELPSWFQNAIQERLEHVVARIEHHPELLHKLHMGDSPAFEAVFSGVYIKGLRDGVQLAITLLDYPISVADKPEAK